MPNQLSFLLDEHISSVVGVQLRTRRTGVRAVSLHEWQGGIHLGEDESLWLGRALEQRLTLVTYDQRTIGPLLHALGESQVSHGGVIFVDHRTIRQGDVGTLVRALAELYETAADEEWTDRVQHLARPKST